MSNSPGEATVFQTYKRLMGYALPHWRRYLLAMIGMTIYAFTQAAFASLIETTAGQGLRDARPEDRQAQPSAWR